MSHVSGDKVVAVHLVAYILRHSSSNPLAFEELVSVCRDKV